MQLLGYILLASMLLVVLRYLVAGLLVAYLIALTVSFITRPGETCALFAFFAIVALLKALPGTVMVAAVAIAVFLFWIKRRET